MIQDFDASPSIYFEDQHLIVLAKPSGLLSQGDISGDFSLVDWCRTRFGRPYVGLIHRLDRNVSGLMVIAKRTKSAERLSKALVNGTLIRKYQALVHGSFSGEKTLTHYLFKNENTNEVKVVTKTTPGAKEAILYARALETRTDARLGLLSKVELTLETGRSHQIRVQLSDCGHPIVGDTKYGAKPLLGLGQGLELKSSFLEFKHPMSETILRFRI